MEVGAMDRRGQHELIEFGLPPQTSISRIPLRAAALKATGAEMLHRYRVTEHMAEVVALRLVHASREWVVARRFQRGEHGDWLLRDPPDGSFAALEVSGTDDGDLHARLLDKLAHVSETEAAPVRAACVVRFVEPMTVLKLVPEVSP